MSKATRTVAEAPTVEFGIPMGTDGRIRSLETQ